MTELQQRTVACDAIIDTYHTGIADVEKLMHLRRDLAVNYYYLTDHAKDIHGQAGLTYIARKYRIAESIVDARANDTKVAMNMLEQQAQKMPSVKNAQEAEVWAEAEREAFKVKVDAIKQVLQSMQQEISHLSFEHRTTHFHTNNGN